MYVYASMLMHIIPIYANTKVIFDFNFVRTSQAICVDFQWVKMKIALYSASNSNRSRNSKSIIPGEKLFATEKQFSHDGNVVSWQNGKTHKFQHLFGIYIHLFSVVFLFFKSFSFSLSTFLMRFSVSFHIWAYSLKSFVAFAIHSKYLQC